MTYLLSSIIVILLIALVIIIRYAVKNDTEQSERIRTLTRELSKANDACKEINHNLNLSLINEITRIEQNIALMDFRIKGVSIISNRILAMKAIFASLGYEIPELAGKPYHHADNHRVTMQFDEKLNPGEAYVKKVIQPAVLFNNELIQSANVIVAFNDK